ncbi:hypothetical protein [Paraliomyxa miuraensis]|uniref:hypothetical protein n=1 Tax=Paraliomyxa miuraensis TaxID=376150 RepID=UPI002253D44F|nr:hypothetical protein [Paraliomyxa miuraensis]MCX4241464.1 hypothetical protein [Paraliomyxa miuraensis]
MASNTLHPSRALLHPAWLGSLAVLALNDHVLKGAGLLPPVITGKLSDFAGLIVAPVLLAVLLRVRGFGPWVACHVAVGAVFCAIQLSATCAAGLAALTKMVGVPWVITRDATDLLALPVLALSLWGLLPAMRRSAARNARRSAEAGLASVGLLCCVATSYEEDDCCWDDEDWGTETDGEGIGDDVLPLPSLQADVVLSNATAQGRVVRIRPLRAGVSLDCATVAEAPGSLLRSELFDAAQSWTLPANTNVEVLDHTAGQAPCYAAWVEADALPPHVILWFDGQPPITTVPGEGQTGSAGELALVDRGPDGLGLQAAAGLAFPVDPIDPLEAGECAWQPDAGRLGWSTPVPWGPSRIEAVEVGLDGCLALELSQDGLAPRTFYLCVPQTSFPFAAGDEIEVRLPQGTEPELNALEIVARDEQGEALAMPSLLASAGSGLPTVADVELQAVPLYGCDPTSEPRCGAVERPMKLLVSGPDLDAVELHAGDAPARQGGDGRGVEVTLLHAQERFVLDPACSLGADDLGPDLEVVIAQWPR